MTQANDNNQRGRQDRDVLREPGLRPIQLWVPDTRPSSFVAKAKQQSKLVNQADAGDSTLDAFIDTAFADLESLDEMGQR